MPPRIVLLTHSQSETKNQIYQVLENIGISVYRLTPEAPRQLFDDELYRAQGVLVVIEFEPDVEGDPMETAILKLLDHHRRNPKLAIIPIIEKSLHVPDRLLAFPGIRFEKRLSETDLRIMVERVLQLLHESEAKAPAGMEELLVEAQLQIPRLKMIIDEPRTVEAIGLGLAALTTLVGIALSIPRVLALLSFAPQWLFVGPILFVAAGLLTLYLYTHRRREQRRTKIATLLHDELESVVREIKLSREKQKTTVTTNG